MEQPPIFVCSNCNVGFPSPGKNDLGISDEKLRKAWHEKVDYFLTRPLSIEDENYLHHVSEPRWHIYQNLIMVVGNFRMIQWQLSIIN